MLPKPSVSHLLIAAMPLAWLVPLHRQPWAAARSDAWAMACLLAAALLAAQPGRLPRPWAAFGALALGTVALQAASGHIFFGGDALLAATYLLAFMLAVALGPGLVQAQAHAAAPPGHTGVFMLSGAVVVCAVVSVGMALAQWTGLATDVDSPWLLPIGEHGRPFANMAQPNHFSTLCFLGLCSLALLRQGRAFGAGIFWPVAAWLLLGMVMSDSRTGAVQLVVMLLLVLLLSRRTGQSVPPLGLVLLLAAHGVGLALWSQRGGGLQLAQASVRATVLEGGGSRWRHWASMWEAIVQEPWWGYGWQQVGVAQVRVADRWPALGEQLSSSHNIALDLLVWNGIPVGATLLALALWWFASRLWRCRDAVSMWLLVGVAGLAVHGLLEWPLEYAYFLVPLGLWIGAIEALQPAQAPAPGPTPALRLPPWATRGLALLLAAVLAAIGADYLPAERFNRHLQLALASPGASYAGPPPPTLRVLSQLAARQRFQIVVAQPGLPDAEVDGLRKVAERYAYAPVMFRYAQTAALNGRPAEATLTLVRLCRIHPAALCDEAGQAWRAWQQRYPQLATVPGPDAASSAPGNPP